MTNLKIIDRHGSTTGLSHNIHPTLLSRFFKAKHILLDLNNEVDFPRLVELTRVPVATTTIDVEIHSIGQKVCFESLSGLIYDAHGVVSNRRRILIKMDRTHMGFLDVLIKVRKILLPNTKWPEVKLVNLPP